MKQYDVAVIGAGATGAAIAWQLSHYDLKVESFPFAYG